MEDKILNNVKNHIGWGEKSQIIRKKKQSENNDVHEMLIHIRLAGKEFYVTVNEKKSYVRSICS